MRKTISSLVMFALANLLVSVAFAQNITIKGKVHNSVSMEAASAVSVTIKGADDGAYTDDKGNFEITTKKALPITLIISSIGYEMQEVTVGAANQPVSVSFVPTNVLGQEVVVSASRVSEKIMETPVSIERVSPAVIRNAPAANYYDIVSNLKGVDVTTSSLTFRTPTTRGFGGSGNVRFNQLVDGMDNQAPGLNFSVGAIVGLNELDVDNMELLSGASSALYGPGGMNGTLLISSKNPFKYQGLSLIIKTGLMHADGSERSPSPYYNWAVRWGKKISDKFAFKITSELIQAKDWIGMDTRNFDRANGKLIPGNRANSPGYDGVNVYGDETVQDLSPILQKMIAAGQIPPFLSNYIDSIVRYPNKVSRTGYSEQELMDPNTVNFKVGASFNYKITNNTEAILSGYWGTGNTIYTGASRYSLKDFKMGQYKFEMKNKVWNARVYTTQENAGQSFNLAATTQNYNELWKPSTTWYPQYITTYLSGLMSGQVDSAAHARARIVADQGRPALGSPQFKDMYNKVRRIPVPKGGGLLDRSDLWGIDGSYNLSEYTKSFADVIVGGNWRKYLLDSDSTLFPDPVDKPIGITEFGAYVQITKELNSWLKLSASGRYDKNENFKGRFTPRITAVIKAKENNNFRLSYQTAYRFPSTQQQWIDLDLFSYKLIGGNKSFVSKYHFDTNPAYYRDSLQNGVVKQWDYPLQKPESLTSFEVGYRGLLLDQKLMIDAYGYWGFYQDFTGRISVIQSKSGSGIPDLNTDQVYSVPINYHDNINTNGFGIGVDYRLPRNFSVSANFSSDNLDVPAGLTTNFNTPKYRLNLGVANSSFGKDKRAGFAINYRWQDGFYFEGDLANGDLPAFQTLDAQVSYKFPKTKSILKLGATNLLNEYYYNAIGNSYVGGLYYISFGYNLY